MCPGVVSLSTKFGSKIMWNKLKFVNTKSIAIYVIILKYKILMQSMLSASVVNEFYSIEDEMGVNNMIYTQKVCRW